MGPGGGACPIRSVRSFLHLSLHSTVQIYSGGGSGSSSSGCERTEDHGFAGDVGVLALSLLDGE